MAQTAILFPASSPATSDAWLARAAQARRISLMLAARDAAILEAFARECEVKAALPAGKQPAIAA